MVTRRIVETVSAIFGAPKTPQAALLTSIARRHHHAAVLIRIAPSSSLGSNSRVPAYVAPIYGRSMTL
jgi:hypothetical protein